MFVVEFGHQKKKICYGQIVKIGQKKKMLESIFGKSKKSRNHQKSNNDDSPNEDNSYVFVGNNNNNNNDPNRPPYPQTLMLNDELIRMGSSSNSMYPSLDPSSMPYSSGSKNHLNVKQHATCRTCSPIDNIPFSINANNNGNNGDSFDDDELEILNILNRVENFMQTSKYEFNLENSILRESI